GLWMGFVSTPAALASGAHHHGEAESGIYILRGAIRFYFGERLEKSVVAEAGDFLYVPPSTVHVEENLSKIEPVEFIVARNGTQMMVVNVPDPREMR
ncbi:MAG: cupin domain-containing protein, partial [Chloroflexota bacterium]